MSSFRHKDHGPVRIRVCFACVRAGDVELGEWTSFRMIECARCKVTWKAGSVVQEMRSLPRGKVRDGAA